MEPPFGAPAEPHMSGPVLAHNGRSARSEPDCRGYVRADWAVCLGAAASANAGFL